MGDGMYEGIDGPPFYEDGIKHDARLNEIMYRLLSAGRVFDRSTLITADRFPTEPPDGSVLRYTKYLAPRGKEYTYVAVRADGRWYSTGRETQPLSWDRMVDAIGDNPCSIATAWAVIPRPDPDPAGGMDPAEWHRQMYQQAVTVDQGEDARSSYREHGEIAEACCENEGI